MSDTIESGAIKVIEIIGISKVSFDEAVKEGLKRAARSLDHIRGIEVLKYSAKVNDDTITEFHADLKVAFVVR